MEMVRFFVPLSPPTLISLHLTNYHSVGRPTERVFIPLSFFLNLCLVNHWTRAIVQPALPLLWLFRVGFPYCKPVDFDWTIHGSWHMQRLDQPAPACVETQEPPNYMAYHVHFKCTNPNCIGLPVFGMRDFLPLINGWSYEDFAHLVAWFRNPLRNNILHSKSTFARVYGVLYKRLGICRDIARLIGFLVVQSPGSRNPTLQKLEESGYVIRFQYWTATTPASSRDSVQSAMEKDGMKADWACSRLSDDPARERVPPESVEMSWPSSPEISLLEYDQ